ncbi:MAG: hydroxyacid dehydrogenase [Planctomycetota bacterium]|jgi:phosphoglycerate dehydrogenase-like enzyme|nr:hydroxyacid dehydrogenase [Planctomycetota bacterium]
MSTAKPVVAINHAHDAVDRFFTPEDLERLAGVAEIRILGDEKDPIGDRLHDVDILMGSWGMRKLDEELLAAAPKLRAVCYAAGSVKNFALPPAFARSVVITSAWMANAVPVAEVSVALITLANKDWFACQDTIRRVAGPDGYREARSRSHAGNFGTAVGLIGFGAIGREVAKRLEALDLDVLVYDPYLTAEKIAGYQVSMVSSLTEIAERCNVVSLHAPNIPETEGMLDATFFTAMRDNATFINTARGKLVVEDALVAELQTGRISAMLDVTFPEPPAADHPFYTLPNCYLTPHRAGSSAGEVRRMGRYAIDDCLAILAGEEPKYRVHEHMLATMA